ncbi:MAG: TonB family protein [Acidobacteria bacterium]|nr:TonB family protein [Acidobacteriota bacterium]
MINRFETGEPIAMPPQERLLTQVASVHEEASIINQPSKYVPSFSLLDASPAERKRRWLALGVSPALEAIAIAAVVWALMEMPHQPEIKFLKQQALIFRLATPPPPAKHAPMVLKRPLMAHLEAAPVVPTVRRTEVPKPELQHLQAPKITEPRIVLPKPAPAPPTFAAVQRPRLPLRRRFAPVKTGSFTPGSAAPGTVHRPLREVQTGGFGAANGIPGNPQENSHTKIASLGSFDLPSGLGHGNGTDGTRGIRGTVASAGFGNAVGSARGNSVPGSIKHSGFGSAVDGHENGSPAGYVRQGGFGSVVAGATAPKTRAVADAAFKPVVILSKPNPVYPAEARKLHIEGDVILSVVFEASGKLDVLSVVQGLGHGMDQAAVQAAENIRFKPAERDGRPVNSAARVHIIFQLAY